MFNKKLPKFSALLFILAAVQFATGCDNSEPNGSDENTETPGNDNPGNDNPGNDDPGNDDPGNDEPGNDDPSNPGNNDPGNDDPGNDDPGNDDPGNDDPSDPGNESNNCENIDFMSSHDNCGTCGNKCDDTQGCVEGTCTCLEGLSDCDDNGTCETRGQCICKPGDTFECYNGPLQTKDVGECKSGSASCVIMPNIGATWDFSQCTGEVLPSYQYVCDSERPELDMDCNGTPDAIQDSDEDGYAICNKEITAILDCCDNDQSCGVSRPDLINPGRVDCFGNHIDDNCSGTVDDNPDIACGSESTEVELDCKIKDRTCSDTSQWTYGDDKNISAAGALALAKAFDACLNVVTEQSGEPGLIEFSISPASDYNIGIDPRQFNIKDGMYDALGNKLIAPRVGDSFVILSSGIAGDAYTELATHGMDDMKLSLGGSIPEPYRTAHKNQLQTHPACASGGADIYDTVRLHLKMRAPQNAKGISFDFRFFSREYPYYVCSKYNDFSLALLTDSQGNAIVTDDPQKADGNISFDRDNNPISVNNAFFTTCAPAPCSGNFAKPMADHCPAMLSCDAATGTCGGNLCTDGKDELAAYYPQFYSSAEDDPQVKRGGGTAWLTTKAPVTPGEIFNLDFYIWDTGDLRFDSSVILDNFQWNCETTTNTTDFAEPVESVN